MAETNYWRTDRPAEGPRTQPLSPGLPVRTFLPDPYEPRYPYPLVVLFLHIVDEHAFEGHRIADIGEQAAHQVGASWAQRKPEKIWRRMG